MAKLMRRNCLAMACLAMVAGLLLSAERAKADDRSDAPPSFPSFTTPSASPSTATFTKPSVFTKPPVAVAAPTIPQAVNVPNVLTRFPEMTARPRVMPTAAPLPVLPKRVQECARLLRRSDFAAGSCAATCAAKQRRRASYSSSPNGQTISEQTKRTDDQPLPQFVSRREQPVPAELPCVRSAPARNPKVVPTSRSRNFSTSAARANGFVRSVGRSQHTARCPLHRPQHPLLQHRRLLRSGECKAVAI